MHISDTALPGVKLIQPVRHGDARGYFSEVYREEAFVRHAIDTQFAQENQSLSAAVGVVRGLHFQIAPMAQAKLLRVISGATSMSPSTSAAVPRPTASTWQSC